MRFRFLLVPLFLLVIASGILLAKSNDTINECTKTQALLVWTTMADDDFFVNYADYMKNINTGDWAEDYADVLRQTLALRETYFTEVQPVLPNCASSLRLQLAFSDVFGEVTVVVSAYNLIKADSQEYSNLVKDTMGAIGERFTRANTQVVDILNELSEVGEFD